ncbi:MAG: hypothetical protein QXX95_07825 [Nitrososphaerales archaeon]
MRRLKIELKPLDKFMLEDHIQHIENLNKLINGVDEEIKALEDEDVK